MAAEELGVVAISWLVKALTYIRSDKVENTDSLTCSTWQG